MLDRGLILNDFAISQIQVFLWRDMERNLVFGFWARRPTVRDVDHPWLLPYGG